MEEDATSTDMDKEYEDDEDENENEEVIAEEEVEPEGWVKHTKAASCDWEVFL